jgi:hypothetical protein
MTSARYDYDFVYQFNQLTVGKKNNLIAPDGRRDADLLQQPAFREQLLRQEWLRRRE